MTDRSTQSSHQDGRTGVRIEVSLTQFLDFLACKDATQRQTRARTILKQMDEPYLPGRDLYKDARDAIQTAAGGKINLRTELLPPNKLAHYPAIEAGYNKFIGRKVYERRQVKRKYWVGEGIVINVNPELALHRNSRTEYLKLYFKAEKLTKPQAVVAHQIMFEMLVDDPITEGIGIIDVRKGKLVTPPAHLPDTDAATLLQAETAYLRQLLTQN